MGVAERRAREKDEKRQRIIRAAEELILEDGFDKLTIRKIADRLEISPGVIYNYFDDKTELLFDFCEEVFEGLNQSFQSIYSPADDPLESFRLVGHHYIQFALDHPAAYIITFCLPPPSGIDGWLSHQAPACIQSYTFLFDLIVRCQAAGHFRPMDPETASQAVWSATHGLASVLLLTHGHYGLNWSSKEALIENTLEMIERGLRADCK